MGDRRLSVSLRQPTPIPLDLEFTCDPGDVLAIFGPSGSGKTTILRSIAGLYRPAQTSVRSGARDLERDDDGDLHSTASPRRGIRVSGVRALSAPDGDGQRDDRARASASRRATCAGGGVARARAPVRSIWTAVRRSSPAASVNVSRWRGHSPASRRCCSSTNRLPPWIARCGDDCRMRLTSCDERSTFR